MRINKEQYREFEFGRPVFMSPFAEGGPTGGEKAEKAKEKPKEKEDVTDQSGKIAEYRKNTEDYINIVIGAVPKQHKDAYRKIAGKLKKYVKARFDKISAEYKTQLENIGTVEFENTGQGKKLEAEAKGVLDNIKKRLDTGYAKYSKHQNQQDRIDTARKKAKEAKNPNEQKEAEAEIRKVKEEIVVDFLNENADTKDMPSKMKAMLARFIVKGNLVNLKYADIDADAYNDNIEAYFKEVDAFNERIGSTLKGKVEKVVNMFLAECPNPDAKPAEITHFKKIISKNAGIKKALGDPERAGSMADKAATILAKRFDIRFKQNGEVAYATDLTARPRIIVYDAKKLINRVTLDLTKAEGDFSSTEKIDTYDKKVKEYTEWLRARRKTIDVGDTFMDWGEIDSWDDWKGSKEAEYLILINDAIRDQVQKIEGKENAKAARERTEAQKKANVKKYNNAAKKAGLQNAINKALGLQEYRLMADKSKIKPEGPYEGYQIIENQKENLQIRIDLNAEEKITVTIKPVDINKDPINLNAELHYTPETFKNKVNDLAALGRTIKENWVNNNKEISRIDTAISKIQINGLDVKFEHGETGERYKNDFKPNEPALIVDGHQVGTLTFLPKSKKGAEKVTINVTEQKPETVDISQLNRRLSISMPKMKEVAKRAETNKKGVDKQVTADQGKVKPVEGLILNWEEPEKRKGDYSKSTELIRVATYNKRDESLAATLYIKAGAPEAKKDKPPKPRQYVLREGNEQTTFNTINDVQKHIENNRVRLAEVPEKQKPVKLKPGMEKAKANLSKIVIQLWGDKMKHVKSTDPEFSNALSRFLNGLDTKRVKELEKPDAKLTPQEQAYLMNAFKEAYYGNLEEEDPNEVKIVGDLPITIKDKITTLAAAFGPDLARTLSMSHQFQKGKSGGVEVKEGGEFVPVNAKGLRKYVPARLREEYDKVIKGEDPKAFKEKAKEEVDGQKTMEELGKIMRNPKKVEAFKKMGITELIASLAQLWKMFQEAFKTGDYKSLEDGLKDFQEGRNPIERIDAAKKAYEKKVKGIKDTGELMELYNQPYGQKANELFTETTDKGTNTVPYRIKLKEVIKERLEHDLNVDISGMEKKSSSETVITCSKGPKIYKIFLNRDGGETFATMQEVLLRNNGSEYNQALKPPIERQPVKNTFNGTDSLGYVLFKKEAISPTAEKEEKPKKKPEIKKGTAIDVATSQEKNKASAEYEKAMSFYKKNTNDQALDAFIKSYAIVASPNTHLMIVRALRKLNYKSEALKEAQLTVEEAKKAKDQKYKESLEAANIEVSELKAE